VWPAAGAALALVVLLVVAGPPVLRRVLPPARPRGEAEVGALTQALVATQVQLARRELDDKNWEAARTQAQNAVHLVPGHVEASQILETARARLAERDAAVANARRALGAGQTAAASEQLSLLLELDPGHPAAAGLSARLNAVFRTQAGDAADATRTARERAVAAGAAGSPEFARAEAAAGGAESLVTSAEYADATRTFLGARDAFDRAGRTARARRATTAAARADANEGRAAHPPTPVPETTPLPPPPRFVAGRTTITTPAAGEPAGFDTADVRTRKPSRFEGRIEFEVRPPEVRPGDPFSVRVQLVNEGPRDVRIEALEITTVEDDQRATGPARLLQRQVPPRDRALVAEYSGVWSAVHSWRLEAVAAVGGGESVRSRLQAE
jgi:hypothetical protein